MKYRAEIDGLRALAVVPVILFHAGFELFGGGFVGVDVFFVISGYLITTILVDDIEKKRFSIINFYERRARRILPALFFVMLVCIPFAWAWMLPSQMIDFSKSFVAVSLFVSNILFWRQSGYFDAAAEEKPLLHTWSLAVEEQYYVLFPIFLFLAWRFGKHRVFWMIAGLAAISLAISEWGWRNQSTANFYLAPTRAWELFAGSLAAFVVQKQGVQENNILSFVGLAAIVFSIFFYDKQIPFPSVYSLVPVVGVVLLVLFAGKGTWAAKILSTRLCVGIGLISYSAYLWHQPLLAFARIKLIDEPGMALMGALSALSLVLAVLTWRFVEQPFRKKEQFNRQKIFSMSLVGITGFVFFGVIGIQTIGFAEQRYDKHFLALNDRLFLRSSRNQVLGNDEIKPNWILLGDSHADALQDGFSEILKLNDQAALIGTETGCPPAMNLWRHDMNYGSKCHDNYKAVLNVIKDNNISNVLMAARYALYLNSSRFDNQEGGKEKGQSPKVLYDHMDFMDHLRADSLRHQAIENELVSYVNQLSQLGTHIYILTSIPEVGWHVPELMRSGSDVVSTSRAVYEQRVASLDSFYNRIQSIPNVTILHSENVLCDASRCIASNDGYPLYYDTNHPSIYGARYLLRRLSEKIFTRSASL
ncbi:acyltransferase family protein [Gynuella sp.]|uniref:acyltransferase family protein n=1 Tax=Gynuella sp. TaxID=2969146 RepID=UPI003D1491A5